MSLYSKNLKVLMIEPAIQKPTFDRAKPNGNLGPAYIIGALRKSGIEADYLDATVGQEGRDLKKTFYNYEELENGLIRVGMDLKNIMKFLQIRHCCYVIYIFRTNKNAF